ncbi:MAG: hypothetical protein J7604_06990, partial [Sporocytophaga sp.]|uniref:hypothetical protein n=1 Tax=Sporocytophaga sp. TaxID=2231183 RepID=UPI001B055CC8
MDRLKNLYSDYSESELKQHLKSIASSVDVYTQSKREIPELFQNAEFEIERFLLKDATVFQFSEPINGIL